MKIESVDVTVFQYPTRRVSDARGAFASWAGEHGQNGDADHHGRRWARRGYSFAPPEVVRPFVVNTFFRKVLVGQDPFNRERIWQDLGALAAGKRASADRAQRWRFVEQALWDLIGRKPQPAGLETAWRLSRQGAGLRQHHVRRRSAGRIIHAGRVRQPLPKSW